MPCIRIPYTRPEPNTCSRIPVLFAVNRPETSSVMTASTAKSSVPISQLDQVLERQRIGRNKCWSRVHSATEIQSRAKHRRLDAAVSLGAHSEIASKGPRVSHTGAPQSAIQGAPLRASALARASRLLTIATALRELRGGGEISAPPPDVVIA